MSHTTPNVTRTAVLDTIALCDELGTPAFLERYGYQPSKRYQLRYGGRSYPSKAILGVAAGLSARQFSGGAAHTVRVLTRLGFHVRDGKPRGVLGWMRDMVRTAAASFPFPRYRNPELPIDPVCLFASGASRVGALRGFAAIGHDIGVVAHAVTPAVEAELAELRGSDIQVFVDSGAFSEVKFGPEGPRVVKPISDAEWRSILDLYRRLALALGDQLHIVAPDMVGHQAETLERLERYAPQLRELDALGARILVPVQKGEQSQADFWRAECDVLGFEGIPALPCMKAATTPAEATAFARDAQPTHLHLLGIGARGKYTTDYLAGIAFEAPQCLVQMDSVLLTGLVGRQDGPQWAGKRRRLTYARDMAAELIGAERKLGAFRQEFAIAVGMA